jgi:hypothetical protein
MARVDPAVLMLALPHDKGASGIGVGLLPRGAQAGSAMGLEKGSMCPTFMRHSDRRVLGEGDTSTGMDYRNEGVWGVGSPFKPQSFCYHFATITK